MMYKTAVHVYEYKVLGAYNYVKTVESLVSHICEDDQLRLHGTAIIDGQQVAVEGGPSSGPRTWKHFIQINEDGGAFDANLD